VVTPPYLRLWLLAALKNTARSGGKMGRTYKMKKKKKHSIFDGLNPKEKRELRLAFGQSTRFVNRAYEIDVANLKSKEVRRALRKYYLKTM